MWKTIAALLIVASACSGVAESEAPATIAAADETSTTASTPPTNSTTSIDAPPSSDASPTTTATPSPTTSTPPTTTTSAPPTTAPPAALPVQNVACDQTGAIPWTSSVSASPVSLFESADVTVEAVVYPHPDYEGKPWSQWGQGFIDAEGRFYSAIGDHIGRDGNSYVYEYDPQARQLTLIADIGAIIDQPAGFWGYGKVHAQMVPGPCGVYFSSYWGSRRGMEFNDVYRGDHLFRLDTANRTITDLTVIHPETGVPSLASSPQHGLIYAEALDPTADGKAGWFVVLDQNGHEVFRSDGDHDGFRAMAVDATGRALFSAGNGALSIYDPATNSISGAVTGLPGSWLRAATPPDPNGVVYGVTRDPEVMFALEPTGAVRTLGEVRGYTTTLAMTADGSTVYYVPGAHGGSWRQGTPVIAVDTATGAETIVTELNDAAEAVLGLTLGGTYNMALTPDGKTLYIGMNAGTLGDRSTFGTVVLLIVHLES